MSQAERLIQRLDAARQELIDLLPRLEAHPELEIYPGWTIREILAHLSGWDDLVIAFVDAFARGEQPHVPAYRMIDEYNAETVSTRAPLDYEHVRDEWLRTRRRLRDRLNRVPEKRFSQRFTLIEGGRGTIADLLEIFVHHDREHAAQIMEWLTGPSRSMIGQR
jgi:uncharacterized protein (TIGR03083 family)